MPQLANIVVPPIPQELTYLLPENLETVVEIGSRVSVPLGKRHASGYVVSLSPQEATQGPEKFKLKNIEKSVGNQRFFHPAQLPFFQWVANYYGDSLSQVIDVAIPPWVPQKFEKTAVLIPERASDAKGTLQLELVKILQNAGNSVSVSELSRRLRGSAQALKRMETKGIVKISSSELLDHHISEDKAPSWAKGEVVLNQAQISALQAITEAIDTRAFKPCLLHGITGSGKTEVYIDAIRHATKLGVGSLIIVPEIALTPQLIDRFRARIGNDIAVLHSGLNKRVRWDSWRALLEGRNLVAIGARSGIFAPVPNLGLIIVDEEHDSSYKQSEGLRYNARDLALVRAAQELCPVVLGSATPSLETWQNARAKKYVYLGLPSRHESGSSLELEIVDLNKVKPWDMPSRSISPRLHELLKGVIDRGEQAFILYNRRGFASYLQCDSCDSVIECPNCSVTMTYHQSSNRMLCHYCNLSVVPPQFCQKCSENKKTPPGTLQQRGSGTERIFEELQKLFPETEMARLDRDSATDMLKYRAILDRVRSGETKILVGTQMIAKGHDLPGVTLVGVADCDVGLHMPDFRAGERVFQLLTQASGRAGRGDKAGQVVLQTRVPKHPSLIKTLEKDFSGFADSELIARQQLHYPPFCRMLRVLISSQDQNLPLEVLSEFSSRLQKFTKENALQVQILGPCPAPLQKLKTHWRCHLLVKAKSPSQLNQIMKYLRAICPNSKKIRVIFDMDPQELL